VATTIKSGLQDTASILSNRLIMDMLEPIQMLDRTSVSSAPSSTTRICAETRSPRTSRSGSRIASCPARWRSPADSPRGGHLRHDRHGRGELRQEGRPDPRRQTGECLRATADGSTSTLTVARGVGGVAAATTAASGRRCQWSSSATRPRRASTLPTMLITQQTRNYNYGQIQRKAWGFDRTARQSSWYSQNVLDSERDKKLSEFKTDRENTVFFGARSYTANGDASGHPLGTAGGLIEYISTNVTDISGASGVLSTTALENFLTDGPAVRVAGQGVLRRTEGRAGALASALEQLGSRQAGRAGVRREGRRRDLWRLRRQIPVIVKQQWGAYGTGTTGQYGSLGFLVDLQQVRLATMQAPVRLSNRQANDLDGIEEEYLCEETLVVAQESAHALLKRRHERRHLSRSAERGGRFHAGRPSTEPLGLPHTRRSSLYLISRSREPDAAHPRPEDRLQPEQRRRREGSIPPSRCSSSTAAPCPTTRRDAVRS
jgi:hypothetical protein